MYGSVGLARLKKGQNLILDIASLGIYITAAVKATR